LIYPEFGLINHNHITAGEHWTAALASSTALAEAINDYQRGAFGTLQLR